MDVTSNPADALVMRAGLNQDTLNLSTIKRQAQADAEVVSAAFDSARPGASNPGLGKIVDQYA